MVRRHHWIVAFLVLAGATALLPRQALAHPHVWIDGRAELGFNAAHKLERVHVNWRFDEMYSADAALEVDSNGDGKISTEEMKAFGDLIIGNLKEWGYFTSLEVDGKKRAFTRVLDHTARFDKGILVFDFTLAVDQPVDPKAESVSLRLYDPSYFVSIEYVSDHPVTFVGEVPKDCDYRIDQPGGIHEALKLSEAYLASLNGSEGVGALFARVMRLTCAS